MWHDAGSDIEESLKERKMNKKLTEAVDKNALVKFIGDALEDLKSSDAYRTAVPVWYFDMGSPNGLHLVIGYDSADNYDSDDLERLALDKSGEFVVNAKLAVNVDDLQSDFDWDWYMPFDRKTGDVWDTEMAITKYETPEDIAKEYLDEFEKMKDLNIDEDGAILDEPVEECKQPIKEAVDCDIDMEALEAYANMEEGENITVTADLLNVLEQALAMAKEYCKMDEGCKKSIKEAKDPARDLAIGLVKDIINSHAEVDMDADTVTMSGNDLDHAVEEIVDELMLKEIDPSVMDESCKGKKCGKKGLKENYDVPEENPYYSIDIYDRDGHHWFKRFHDYDEGKKFFNGLDTDAINNSGWTDLEGNKLNPPYRVLYTTEQQREKYLEHCDKKPLKESGENKGEMIAKVIAKEFEGKCGPFSEEDPKLEGNRVGLYSQNPTEWYTFNSDGSVDVEFEGPIEGEDDYDGPTHFDTVKDLLTSDLLWFWDIENPDLLLNDVNAILKDDTMTEKCGKKPMRESKNLKENFYGDTVKVIQDVLDMHDNDMVDLIYDLVDRALDNAKYNGDVWDACMQAIDEGMIYTEDQWKAYQYYCDMGDDKDIMWESLIEDVFRVTSEMLENGANDPDPELEGGDDHDDEGADDPMTGDDVWESLKLFEEEPLTEAK